MLCFKMRKYISKRADNVSFCMLLLSLGSRVKETALRSASTSSLAFEISSCRVFFLSLNGNCFETSLFCHRLFFFGFPFSSSVSSFPRSSSNLKDRKTSMLSGWSWQSLCFT
uniref:Uncharacterized protein n=1 Tax=Arundo donax TaxID=35708 RepID=A0A0A9FMI5_ARUDO